MLVIEILANARYNLSRGLDAKDAVGRVQITAGMEQLNNTYEILDKGYSQYDDYDELILKHGNIDSIPEAPE